MLTYEKFSYIMTLHKLYLGGRNMFCSKCGEKIMEEAVICPHCGCYTNNQKKISNPASNSSGLKTAAKIFMILGCVFTGLSFLLIFPLIALAWQIPMTVSYCKKIQANEPVSTSFKVCSLLFVSLIAGILMLCDKD